MEIQALVRPQAVILSFQRSPAQAAVLAVGSLLRWLAARGALVAVVVVEAPLLEAQEPLGKAIMAVLVQTLRAAVAAARELQAQMPQRIQAVTEERVAHPALLVHL